jgi:hypothetical protein
MYDSVIEVSEDFGSTEALVCTSGCTAERTFQRRHVP